MAKLYYSPEDNMSFEVWMIIRIKHHKIMIMDGEPVLEKMTTNDFKSIDPKQMILSY